MLNLQRDESRRQEPGRDGNVLGDHRQVGNALSYVIIIIGGKSNLNLAILGPLAVSEIQTTQQK